MSKVVEYLQKHIVGEVVTAPSVRKYFSTDGGIFTATPQIVIYPKDTEDVQKVARFSWQLAEKGHKLPITARGRGTDQSGAAIGRGLLVVLPAHMNKLTRLDASKGVAHVQPGMMYRNFQDMAITHGLFLPPYPSSIDFSTIGGAIANNAGGEKSVKYGDTRQFIRGLEVVLANGEIINTRRLTKRELKAKKALDTLEGEIYRKLDDMLTANAPLVKALGERFMTSKNSSGYALNEVKQKDGSFDLTPLFVGSQGTLGIVTEAEIELEGYNPNTSLIVAHFDSMQKANDAVSELLPLGPSALEVVDKNLYEFLDKHMPMQLDGLVEKPFPALTLLIEFDDTSDRVRQRRTKKALKTVEQLAKQWVRTDSSVEQSRLWQIRHSAAAVIWHTEGAAKALPIIEDGIVPQHQLKNFLTKVYALFRKYDLEIAVWGHAGDANLHMQPFLDLSKVSDRKKVFSVMDDYYNLVMKLGGSISGEHGDGRLRGPYLDQLFGKDIYAMFLETKDIFDPHAVLNPGVKMRATKAESMALLRHEYSMAHLYDHLPRT